MAARKISKTASGDKRSAKAKQAYLESCFTSELVKRDHTIVETEMIAEMVDKYLATMQLDPLVGFLSAIGEGDNPLAQTHKTAWHLIRLLCFQAASRMGGRSPTDKRGLPVFPLTDNEVNIFNKLATTVVNSKNSLLKIRQLKLQEKTLEKDEEIGDIVNVQYTREEIDLLSEIAKKKDKE